MPKRIAINQIDLRRLTRGDVEGIKNPVLREAIINALFALTIGATTHQNHSSHSDHTKYTQSIKEQVALEGMLDVLFAKEK